MAQTTGAHGLPDPSSPREHRAPCTLVVLLAGCVSVSEEGPNTVFEYETWIQLMVPLAAIAAFILGFRRRRGSGSLALAQGWGLMIGSVLLGPFLTLYVTSARLRLSDDGFTETGALGLSSEPLRVHFPDVTRIEVVRESSVTRKRRSYLRLHVYEHTGAYRSIDVSALMREGALGPVLERAERVGIAVIDRS